MEGRGQRAGDAMGLLDDGWVDNSFRLGASLV